MRPYSLEIMANNRALASGTKIEIGSKQALDKIKVMELSAVGLDAQLIWLHTYRQSAECFTATSGLHDGLAFVCWAD